MSKDPQHFKVKYPHTEIKHKLLSACLERCLSISNSYNNVQKEKRKFTYMDLYAGCGEFDDKTQGSPLIALNLIEEQLNSDNNNFNNVKFIATEKNAEYSGKLKQSIEYRLNNSKNKNAIESTVFSNSWEECKNDLCSFIKSNQWGFVFVDPFSTELNLGELKKLVNNNIYYKDILILINNNAHERILGCTDNASLEKISHYFDVDLRVIKLLKTFALEKTGNNEAFDNAKIIRFLISQTFKDLDKDFIINLAIPRSREGSLENADRFYLCLISGSIGVANQFLSTYATLLGEKDCTGQGSLFDGHVELTHFQLNEKIKEIIAQEKSVSLFRLVSKLFNDFYSWKSASETQIPTSKNLQKALNYLTENNLIKVNSDLFIDSRCKRYKKITTDAFKSKKNLKQVMLSI